MGGEEKVTQVHKDMNKRKKRERHCRPHNIYLPEDHNIHELCISTNTLITARKTAVRGGEGGEARGDGERERGERGSDREIWGKKRKAVREGYGSEGQRGRFRWERKGEGGRRGEEVWKGIRRERQCKGGLSEGEKGGRAGTTLCNGGRRSSR